MNKHFFRNKKMVIFFLTASLKVEFKNQTNITSTLGCLVHVVTHLSTYKTVLNIIYPYTRLPLLTYLLPSSNQNNFATLTSLAKRKRLAYLKIHSL